MISLQYRINPDHGRNLDRGGAPTEGAELEPVDISHHRQAADALLAIAGRVAEAGIEPMPIEEIEREVKAVRAERRRRAGGS